MKLFYDEDNITLYQGNVEEVLYEMPAQSIQCVVTSPPYYALRDYGIDGQIGLEESLPAYIERMVGVFRGLWHVLRDDGTVWLNIGDTYAGGGNYNGNTEESLSPKQKSNRGSQGDLAIGRDGVVLSRNPGLGIKNKELMGVPWRLAFALQDDGWYLRRDVIWEKPNPMPESCRDRPTTAHEYLFMLTKKPSYFFDQIAVKEPHHPDGRQKTTISGSNPGVTAHENYAAREGKDRWPEGGRNIRSVWKIPTQPMPEAHFATFPEKLVEPCVKASTSEKGCCPQCGAPWVRVVEEGSGGSFHDHSDDLSVGQRQSDGLRSDNFYENYRPPQTVGWEPGCRCPEHTPIPCNVLDPFVGSGTVPLVARRLGRHGVGIDLSPDYLKIAQRRVSQWYKKPSRTRQKETQGQASLFG